MTRLSAFAKDSDFEKFASLVYRSFLYHLPSQTQYTQSDVKRLISSSGILSLGYDLIDYLNQSYDVNITSINRRFDDVDVSMVFNIRQSQDDQFLKTLDKITKDMSKLNKKFSVSGSFLSSKQVIFKYVQDVRLQFVLQLKSSSHLELKITYTT